MKDFPDAIRDNFYDYESAVMDSLMAPFNGSVICNGSWFKSWDMKQALRIPAYFSCLEKTGGYEESSLWPPMTYYMEEINYTGRRCNG